MKQKESFLHRVIRIPSPEKWGVPSQVFFVLVFILPLLIFSVASTYQVYGELTDKVLRERRVIASLAALNMQSNLDRMTSVALSLASQSQVRILMERERWSEAVLQLEDILYEIPAIERIFLTNMEGVLMADLPEIPEVHDQDFSFRDWYQGVMREQAPYVSRAYVRTAPPQHNVVTIAVPIVSRESEPVGIMSLQLKLDTLLNWAQTISSHSQVATYFIDQGGGIVGYPLRSPQDEILNIGDLAPGEHVFVSDGGVFVGQNPISGIDELIAVEPVARHGWLAVVSEDEATAFAARDHAIRLQLIIYGLAQLMALAVAYLMLQLFRAQAKHEEALILRAEELERKVKDRTSELQEKVDTLERLNRTMVGRELKMVELKKRIAALEKEASEKS